MCGEQLLLDTYLPELEQLKLRIATREREGDPMRQHVAGSTQDTVQLVTSNLPELSNWGACFTTLVAAVNSKVWPRVLCIQDMWHVVPNVGSAG